MRYVSGPYTTARLSEDIRAIELALTSRYLSGGVITDAAEQRDWDRRIHDASMGRNMVYFDDQGHPSVMVRVDPMQLSQLDPEWVNAPHPAFVVDGSVRTLYVGKYQALRVGASSDYRVATLRGVDPQIYMPFDTALNLCRASGLSLLTDAAWAFLALRCLRRGYQPRGNNLYGRDHGVAEYGVPSYTYQSSGKDYIGRTYTGSGPDSWSDDGTPYGIFDLNGNIWERTAGLRLVDGEIQIIPGGDAALAATDMSETSTAWRAILPTGELVDPGTEDTLKYDGETATPSGIRINTEVVNDTGDTYTSKEFETLVAADGVAIPPILQHLGLAPAGTGLGSDHMYMRSNGEMFPLRGGSWTFGSYAGVFSLYLTGGRANSSGNLGLRALLAI